MIASFLIPPTVVLVVGGLAFRPLARWGRPVSMPACSCGYALEGLPSGVCPECGTSHASTWAAFQIRRRVRAMLLWSATTAGAGAAAAMLTAPMRLDRTGYALYTYPANGPNRCDLQLDWTSAGPPGRETFLGGSLLYTKNGVEERVIIRPEESDIPRRVEELFAGQGTPYPDAPGEFEARVAAAVAALVQNPEHRPANDLRSNSFSGGSAASSSLTPRWWTLGVLVPVLVLGWRRLSGRS